MSEEGGQTFLDHLEDLRRRLLRALIALVVGTVVSSLFAKRMLEWMARPVGGLQRLEAIEVTENLGVFMRATLLGGVTLAMPVIVYQLWRFINPALEPSERRYVFLLVPLATALFVSGAAFAYFVMLPAAVPFLLEFLSIPTRPRPANYVSFITSLMLWLGISFETPLVIFFLAKVKVVNHRTLAQSWRTAIILIAVLAAVVTPTGDPVNMGLMMAPLIVLYGLSILLARIAQ
ncbi:MAG: twin-arginine translocase subunit TatC [Anaerolineae bacterium]|jgi:sec-independent protein translocase protein TatC